MAKRLGYNERLFKGGLRAYLHNARFHNLARAINSNKKPLHIVELGCFDGRVLDFIEPSYVTCYEGFDAGWENGLDLAIERHGENQFFRFAKCESPESFDPVCGFNAFISLETLEHLEEEQLHNYLRIVTEKMDPKCFIMVSVPNEIGLIFLMKQLVKRFVFREKSGYSIKEFLQQIVGKTQNIIRDQHKGFNYRTFEDLLKVYFDITYSYGLPFRVLPRWLAFSVVFECKKRIAP